MPASNLRKWIRLDGNQKEISIKALLAKLFAMLPVISAVRTRFFIFFLATKLSRFEFCPCERQVVWKTECRSFFGSVT